MVDYTKARLHNLLIRIYKEASKDELRLDYRGVISKGKLKKLFFRKADFRMIDEPNALMDKVEGGYRLTVNAKKKVAAYIVNHNKYKADDKYDEKFMKLFSEAKDILSSRDYEKMKSLYVKVREMLPLAPAIHWKYQPEHEEYLLMNSGQIPEDDLLEFYDHYHMLEDLYWVVADDDKQKKVDSYLGDVNLDKKFYFKVHSNRWGHEDTYTIKRTLDGWYVDFMSYHKEGDKYGSAILFSLDHDRIIYPYNVKDYFAQIWDYADGAEVDVEDVRQLMQIVADWISATEEGVKTIENELQRLMR